MINAPDSENISSDLAEKAMENFENIQEAIKGLYNILKISLPKNTVFRDLGIDNVLSLYKNVLELMNNDHGTKRLMRKIRRSELDVDIPLDT